MENKEETNSNAIELHEPDQTSKKSDGVDKTSNKDAGSTGGEDDSQHQNGMENSNNNNNNNHGGIYDRNGGIGAPTHNRSQSWSNSKPKPKAGYKCKICNKPGGEEDSHWFQLCPYGNQSTTHHNSSGGGHSYHHHHNNSNNSHHHGGPGGTKNFQPPKHGYFCKHCGAPGGTPESHWYQQCPYKNSMDYNMRMQQQGPPGVMMIPGYDHYSMYYNPQQMYYLAMQQQQQQQQQSPQQQPAQLPPGSPSLHPGAAGVGAGAPPPPMPGTPPPHQQAAAYGFQYYPQMMPQQHQQPQQPGGPKKGVRLLDPHTGAEIHMQHRNSNDGE